jgi:endo-1,4-beta-D-glucanase Y
MKFLTYFFLILCTSIDLTFSTSLSNALHQTWKGIKQRNIDAYNVRLVHRPYSETPGDAVSEGVGYGMLVALYSNDQEYFNIIWESAEQYMWNGRGYDWRVDSGGNKVAYGYATDAEQDIAVSLIFAQNLVDEYLWIPHYNPSYGERAQSILNNMWDSRMISWNNNVAPGAGWGGDDFVNPGYFAPAWYRIFSKFDKTPGHNWNRVINNCYNTILNNVGFNNGLIPDWTTTSGDFYNSDLGYNTYGNGNYMFKDGIRILWRISTDYLWNKDSRAALFLNNSYNFIESKGGASACNYYMMNGELIPEGDIWYFDNGQKQRPRREHSHLTVGMWSTVSYALGKQNTFEYENKLMSFYSSNNNYWGLTDSDNEMYFDQFLAWFGAIMLNNSWTQYLITI